MIKTLNIIDSLGTGGTERVLMNTIDYTKSEVQHTIMLKDTSINVYGEYIKENNIEIIETPKIRYLFRHLIFVYKYFKKNANNIDLVHYYGGTLNYYLPIVMSKFFNIPILIHSHNSQANNPKLRNLHVLIRFVHNLFFNSFNIACSKEAGAWMFGSENNFKLIINGIETEKYKKAYHIGQKKKKSYFPEDAVVIGNIGRFNRQKNHEFLLYFLSYLHKSGESKYHLLLVGEGELEKNIVEKAKELEIDNFIRILSFQQNIEEYYGLIDIFMMPSLFEGLPLVLIEAQAAGIPILVSDKVDSQIKINDNLSFFNLNDSLEEIEKNFTTVLYKGHQESSLVHTDFELEVMSKKILKIYKTLSIEK